MASPGYTDSSGLSRLSIFNIIFPVCTCNVSIVKYVALGLQISTWGYCRACMGYCM